ncbi:hypothetical protein J6590_061515, partial [Homalodisca vitripennis]
MNNRMDGNRCLWLYYLPAGFVFEWQSVAVAEKSFVHDALYRTPVDIDHFVMAMSNILEFLMAKDP